MIIINKNQENNVALTLFEKTTIPCPYYYLFLLVNVQKNTIHTFLATDISGYKKRYNQFNIVETTDPNPMDGEVELNLPGRYYYFIYAQESDSNLDPELANELVEQGILTVRGESSTTSTAYETKTEGHVYRPITE